MLNLDSNVIVESRDVEFIENKFLNDSNVNSEPEPNKEFTTAIDTSTITRSTNNKRKAIKLLVKKEKIKELGKKRILVLILYPHKS